MALCFVQKLVCGDGVMRLFSGDMDQKEFGGETPFSSGSASGWPLIARIFRSKLSSRSNGRSAVFTDRYFSSTVQRWLRRFRDFRRDSLPSSSAFYRKRGFGHFLNASICSGSFDTIVSKYVIEKILLCYLTGISQFLGIDTSSLMWQVYGLEKLHDALLNRPKNKPLITLLPPRVLNAQNFRWTLCASDRCFSNPVTSAFFRSVKVLPVSRGDGIYQMGMDMAISKLNTGGWVHIFPEGICSRNGGKTVRSSKRGVGRREFFSLYKYIYIFLHADTTIVLPFVHTGMQDVMPISRGLARRYDLLPLPFCLICILLNFTCISLNFIISCDFAMHLLVTVLIGDPIHFDDLLNVEDTSDASRGKLYDAFASRIGHHLQNLKVKVDKLALEQYIELENHNKDGAECAANFLHQVDWDPFGLGNHEYMAAESSVEKTQDRTKLNDIGPEEATPDSERLVDEPVVEGKLFEHW
ncbi:Subunits of heterodimeric actin filament capping protein Capz superfamily isoform 1 [Hibiscus syriacus]|uniref:Tafazzin family protein n=1 Tax=Hibiscus syriacus TaxID=106335 RepID=A0A6A3D0W7_HIBSY|nr:Subunits of heterodimeric actin filament capping protein Capz superfamily isoform 1 [Hibiscus syriacus]